MALNKCFFLSLISLVIFSGAALASSTTISSTTFSASAVSNSQGVFSVSIQLMNLTGSTTNQIWWDAAGVQIGTTVWRRADSYIIIYSTITLAGGGIQIYTDNTASDANPKYSGTGTNPSGLIETDSPSSTPVPLCWRITDVSTTTLTIQGSGTSLYSAELGAGYPCFFAMKDKKETDLNAFTNGEDYVIVKDWYRGIHAANSSTGFTQVTSPDCIYIGANFSGALLGKTYQTTTLRIEAFTE